jgi:hypothetical protein
MHRAAKDDKAIKSDRPWRDAVAAMREQCEELRTALMRALADQPDRRYGTVL